MKRIGNIYQSTCSIDNLYLADKRARKGKAAQYGIRVFDRNPDANILLLHESLINKTFRTSEYTTFIVKDPKERIVYRLPYYPDRIVHHAVMAQLEPMFVSTFTADTYSCIKKKGIHAAARAVKKALKDEPGTRFCLKLDVRKFYPSVNHEILKALLRKKLKDPDMLWLLDGIINSAPGLPIGNYLSQYLANFYLTYFDHWIKEVKRVKYYFRYADDIVVMAGSKEYLHSLFIEIRDYLARELKLEIKNNYQVFPIEARGLDFLGYVFFHRYTRLRKSIKQNFARKVANGAGIFTVESYKGWAKHANTKNLLKKLLPHEYNKAS